jgi:hypothetical protein
MTDASDPGREQPAPRQRQYQFGLKSLFVLTTILCVWLGYKTVRERRASEVNARFNSLLDAVVSNIGKSPPNANYRLNPGSLSKMQQKARWPGEEFYLNTILRTGSSGRIASRTLGLDISRALATASAKSVKEKLIDHYTDGLAALNMSQRSHSANFSSERIQARSVWASPANELSAVFDVDLHVEDATAEIRILLIDSQQLNLW